MMISDLRCKEAVAAIVKIAAICGYQGVASNTKIMNKERVKIYRSSKWEILFGSIAMALIAIYILSNEYSIIALISLLALLFLFPMKFIELNSKTREINELVQILFIKKHLKKIDFQEIRKIKIDLEERKGYTAYATLISGDNFKIHFAKTKERLLEKLEPVKELIKE